MGEPQTTAMQCQRLFRLILIREFLCLNNFSVHIPCFKFRCFVHDLSFVVCAPLQSHVCGGRFCLVSNCDWVAVFRVEMLQNDVAWSVPTLKLVQMTGCNADATINSQIHRIRLNSNVSARKQHTLTSHSCSRSPAHVPFPSLFLVRTRFNSELKHFRTKKERELEKESENVLQSAR